MQPIGPNERNMGIAIAALLRLFQDRMPDPETNARLLELSVTTDRWSAGHALFDSVRQRLLAIKSTENLRLKLTIEIETRNKVLQTQYDFEESCLQAMYNATNPNDPFDSSSPYWIAAQAIGLARLVGIPVEKILEIISPEKQMP